MTGYLNFNDNETGESHKNADSSNVGSNSNSGYVAPSSASGGGSEFTTFDDTTFADSTTGSPTETAPSQHSNNTGYGSQPVGDTPQWVQPPPGVRYPPPQDTFTSPPPPAPKNVGMNVIHEYQQYQQPAPPQSPMNRFSEEVATGRIPVIGTVIVTFMGCLFGLWIGGLAGIVPAYLGEKWLKENNRPQGTHWWAFGLTLTVALILGVMLFFSALLAFV